MSDTRINLMAMQKYVTERKEYGKCENATR